MLKKAQVDKVTEKKERRRENERIMEEGRRLREDREREMRRKAEEREELEGRCTRLQTGLDHQH